MKLKIGDLVIIKKTMVDGYVKKVLYNPYDPIPKWMQYPRYIISTEEDIHGSIYKRSNLKKLK
jgi:hypothetical protein